MSYNETSYGTDDKMEDFWIGFKNMMLSFYSRHDCKWNIEYPFLRADGDYKEIIQEWSRRLNILKENGNYLTIEYIIYYIIGFVGQHMLEVRNSYYMNIYLTYVKRWKKLDEPHTNVDEFKPEDYIYDFFRISTLSCELYRKTGCINEGGYKELVKLVIEEKQAALLDELRTVPELGTYIYELYGISNINMSSAKLINGILRSKHE
jgi:hypothetical protein